MSIQRRRVVTLAVSLAVSCLSSFLSSCTFTLMPIDLDALGVDDAAVPPDSAVPLDLDRDDRTPDLLVDAPPPAPDFTAAGSVLFSLDVRSDSVWKALEQPPLVDYAQTIGHYYFNEATSPLLDASPKKANLSPVGGGAFSGNWRVFTPLLDASGTGFVRTGAEFLGAGFVSPDKTQFDVSAEDFTIEAWFKLVPGYEPTSNGACDPIAVKGPTSGYSVCVASGGLLRMTVNWTKGNRAIQTTVGFADGAWHLGAFVFHVSAKDAAAIFVDGANVTPNMNDLSVPKNESLSNTNAAFTVGGAGSGSFFRGSLAELCFHDKKVLALADHQIEYRGFSVPVSPPGAASDVTYSHASTLCTVVADDAKLGERVACYAGSPNGPSQFALARNELADPAGNPGLLGMALAPASINYVPWSESVDLWSNFGATTQADSAPSPRGDTSAETVMLPTRSAMYFFAAPGRSGALTFSVWLRGQNVGDRVYLRIADENGPEFNHCVITFTGAKWKRYACKNIFAMAVSKIRLAVETYPLGNDGALPPVSLDVWGAQLEAGPAPTPYIPNAGNPSVLRREVVLTLKNPNASYLAGGAGRLAIAYTGDDALPPSATLFDTWPGLAGRIVLGRNVGQLEAQILDGAGMTSGDSLMSVAAGSWSMPHVFQLSWNAMTALSAMSHTMLRADATTSYGRSASYPAASPTTLYIGVSQDGSTLGPTGTLQAVTVWDRP